MLQSARGARIDYETIVPRVRSIAGALVALLATSASAHAESGQTLVAAPVLGRPDAAVAGQLVIVAGGPADGDLDAAHSFGDHRKYGAPEH